MHYTLVIFFFVLGAIVGSFLNVVVLRYNSGVTLLGRSRCFSCSARIRWFDLVPVVSFVALRGRCRRCRSRISLQYPLVELVTGIVFALVVSQHAACTMQHAFFSFDMHTAYCLLRSAYYWLIFSILIAIAVYDLRHKIIPNGLVYIFITGAFLYALGIFDLLGNWKLEIGNVISGPLLAAPFAALWLFSRGRWMGLGDAKLALGMGWLLGVKGGLAALVLSFWLGALVSLGILCVQRLRLFSPRATVTLKSEIPFGPFLVAGTFVTWFFGIDVAAIVRWF